MNILKFPLNIQLSATRPIFTASICGKELSCLLDTGVYLPVYCAGDGLFNIFTHDIPNVNTFKSVNIKGFGVEAEKAILYNFDNFSISDFTTTVNFKNCKVAVTKDKKMPCDLIIPISLFIKSAVLLDYESEVKTLRIRCAREEYGVGYYQPKNSIYVFSQ